MVSDMEAMLKVACDLCHSTDKGMLWLMMPMKYSGQDYTAVLENRRRIEDKLMLYQMRIDLE
eukprot:8667519-Alexandrium_andersonii.AAC.1